VTWRSCSPSGACTPITSRCGDGYSVTPRKWNDVCARGSKPTNDSWRVDFDLHPGQGKWVYLYDSTATGATIDFLLSAKRDAAAAERFLAKALGRANHLTPRVINTDKHAAYLAGDCPTQKPRVFWRRTANTDRCSTSGNVLEQDHRAIKRRVHARQNFRSFWGSLTRGLSVGCGRKPRLAAPRPAPVNLIGGGQHKGVIRAVDLSFSTRRKCGNFPSFVFSQKIVARNKPSTSRLRPDQDRW
jgi:hypothetical protein